MIILLNSDLSVYPSIFLMTLAGTPPTIVLGSTSLVTTAPAATTAPSPMVTPARNESDERIKIVTIHVAG